MSRHAQTQHVFSFILIGVVIVTTIILATGFITTLTERSCEAGVQQLAQELEEIANVYDTRGTLQDVTLATPCNARMLCIASPEAQDVPSEVASEEIRGQLSLAIQATDAPNVFLVRDGTLEDLATIPKFSPEAGVVCKESQGGRFSMRVEGLGRTIDIR